jgi:multisubunit Na+/H+ antiporter MnhF subunit
MPAVDDFKSFNRLDQVVLGAGVLAFILSFFHVFVASVSGAGASLVSGALSDKGHATAWHNWGIFAMLLIIVATAFAAVRLFAPSNLPTMAVGVNLLTFALAALGFLCLIIAWFHNSSSTTIGTFKLSVHLGIFGYLLLLASLAQTVAAFLLFRASGETTPDFKAMGNRSSNPAVEPPPYGTSTPPPPATAPTSSYPTTPAGDYTLDDQPPAPNV